MPNELAPCPFCGASGAELVTYHEPGTVLHPWYRVECDHCGAKGPGTDRGTHREDWNRRTNLDQARAAFQNFHRLLCGRFGYRHDEADWERDQASLIEHIAALAATAQWPASRGMSYADRIANRLAQWKNWRPITDAIAIAAEADAEIAALTATANEAAAQADGRELLREMVAQIDHLQDDLITAEVDEFGLQTYVPKQTLIFSNFVGAVLRWRGQARAALAAQPVQAQGEAVAVRCWPFVESPGDFTERFKRALDQFPTYLAALRNVLIENPPTLSADYVSRATNPAPAVDRGLSEAVRWRDVVAAITAAQADNARRGGMFPQEADEHARDAAAVARIKELLTWYGDAAYKLEAWPTLAASAPSQAEPTHRHIKRGTTYTERARGRLQVDEGVILRDMCPLVAYQSTDDGEWWFRPVADFDNPRRFEKVAPSQAGSCQASGDDRAAWFAVAMNAAASLEDAACCLRDPDAKASAIGAAKHVREKCNAMWAAPPAQWQQPGPVTPEHPLECLIVLQSLRQSDGDWWIAGSTFLPEYQPIAWSPDTPEAREALGLPAEPADDDTGAPT